MRPLLWIVPTLLLITIACRFLWHWRPSVWTCCLFWTAIAAWYGCVIALSPTHLISRVASITGFVMNATVTIANRGFMPVIGEWHSSNVWRAASTSHRLLLLADRSHWWGCSPGDFVIALGVVLYFMKWVP